MASRRGLRGDWSRLKLIQQHVQLGMTSVTFTILDARTCQYSDQLPYANFRFCDLPNVAARLEYVYLTGSEVLAPSSHPQTYCIDHEAPGATSTD